MQQRGPDSGKSATTCYRRQRGLPRTGSNELRPFLSVIWHSCPDSSGFLAPLCCLWLGHLPRIELYSPDLYLDWLHLHFHSHPRNGTCFHGPIFWDLWKYCAVLVGRNSNWQQCPLRPEEKNCRFLCRPAGWFPAAGCSPGNFVCGQSPLLFSLYLVDGSTVRFEPKLRRFGSTGSNASVLFGAGHTVLVPDELVLGAPQSPSRFPLGWRPDHPRFFWPHDAGPGRPAGFHDLLSGSGVSCFA